MGIDLRLADAWDAGEQHPSRAHPRHCYPHAECNPYTTYDEAKAWSAGCRKEEDYLNAFGQFDPTGARHNPYRYPPKPLVTESQQNHIRALHDAGVGVKRIGRELGINNTLVRKVVRGESVMPYMWI